MGGKPCMQHEEGLLADLVQPFGVHAFSGTFRAAA